MSAERAAQLYECFLQDTLEIARRVPGVERWIAYTPSDQEEYFRELAPDYRLIPQGSGELGERLDRALTHCLQNGAAQAVIIGSDSPTLPSEYVARAFTDLENADVTLGPSEDGGYYLIGIKQPQPRLLCDVRMSTPHVLRDTLEIARAEGLNTTLLPGWYDVDTHETFARLQNELRHATNGTARRTREFLKGEL